MKKTLFLFFLFLYLKSNSQNSCRIDSIKTEQILGFNYNKYLGKKIEFILNSEKLQCFEKKTFYFLKPSIVKGIWIKFNDSLTVALMFNKSHYKYSFNNEKHDWTLENLSHEILYECRIEYLQDEFWVSPSISKCVTKSNKKKVLEIFRKKKNSFGNTRRFDAT